MENDIQKEVIPLDDKLTPKQERFIQNIVSGMSQRQAYKEAYNAENMKDETIDTEASLLFNDPKVAKRYKELIDKLEDKAIMTAKERMEWLTEVIMDIQKEGVKVKTSDSEFVVGEGTADLNTKMRAIDILNRMSGEYVNKVEADVNSNVSIDIALVDDEE